MQPWLQKPWQSWCGNVADAAFSDLWEQKNWGRIEVLQQEMYEKTNFLSNAEAQEHF